MTAPADLKPGQVVSFQLVSDVIRNQYNNATVMCTGSYDVAIGFDSSIDRTLNDIYDDLPDGSSRNPRDYIYLVVKLPDEGNGVEIRSFALSWIKDPVTVVEYSSVQAVISNAGPADIDRIRKALQVYGYYNVAIKVIND